MPLYQSPGVYIQEVPPVSVPFGRVSTSTAGFIGRIPAVALPTSPAPTQTGPKGSNNTLIALPVARSVVVVPFKQETDKTKYEANVVALPAADTPQLFTSFSAFARQYGDLLGDIGNPELAYVYTGV